MTQDKMTLEDWLDDLCVRFIINLPREDLESVARICFQIEEAQWFYEDFIRPLDPNLPSMSLRSFSLKMFQHCPLLASFSIENHIRAFEEFMQYKTRVPVRGAVMLNDNMDAAVLVRGYKKGASWSFPRGKINKDEDDLDCAIREVYEETGYDLREAGLVEKNEPVHPLEVTMHDQQVRLYVFRGIPEDTIFETRTRKEIGAIRWYKVSDLPAYRKKRNTGRNNGADGPSNDKFYMVAPFMVQLRQWVMKQRKFDARKAVESGGHLYPHVLYEENLTDDNVIHEVHEPVQAPPALTTHPEDIDNATKELHRLLKVKPPTQGLQVPPPSSNQQSGSALMSLLQPKVASGEHMHHQTQGIPHTPYDHTYTEVPQPQAPHHHHPTQRMPSSSYGVPPQFSMETPDMGYSQHRARARVDITNIHLPHGPNMAEQPRQFAPQVPLVHPQPLPPQVQKAMLLRTFASTPQMKGPNTQQAGPSGFSQENQQFLHGGQVHHPNMQGGPVEKGLSAQLSTHPANLLNVLKGNVSQANADQYRGPISPQHVVELPAEQVQQHQYQPSHEFANQYGNPAMATGFNAAPGSGTTSVQSSSGPRPIRPTDKHRVGLLDMFKRAESPVAQGQVDGVDTSRRPSQPGMSEKRQPWTDQSSSTAGTLRAAAKENGRPIQMNPETNLPFGALTILSRSQANKSPAAGSTVSGGRNTIDTARYSAMGSQHSPRSTFNKASPSLSRASPRSYQQTSQMQHQLPQASPRSYGSYPYGASQGNAPNPLSLLSGPPSASTLLVPSGTQPRRESTTEQRNTLLSLFGQSKSSFDQGKGKEPATMDQFGTPRSRLGSVASSGGDSAIPTALRSNASRRSSQAPLSSADTDFLLNFLGNASGSARR
ncbi:hypothetical protein GGR53DRAFT_501398 [Hypoxylon sp. FL1150]|nr:hypothetical protein GGR53DRAFT_501398 [Hypoxylon sp. FL1150]